MLNSITDIGLNIDSSFKLTKKTSSSLKNSNIPKESSNVSKSDDIQLTKKIVDSLNEIPGNELKFDFNEDAGMITVKVYEKDSDQLIREFPSQEFFNQLLFFQNTILPGLIIDEKF